MGTTDTTTTDTKPMVGDGVTLHDHGCLYPGTIIRVSTSGRCAWFQLDAVSQDDGDGTAARFVPDGRTWIFRAIRQRDGIYREDHDMKRVDVGVRRFRWRRNVLPGAPGERGLIDLEEAVELIEPWLLKTRWYPMTGMMIPGVLKKTDELLAEIAAFKGRDDSEAARSEALRERLVALKRNFKRKY